VQFGETGVSARGWLRCCCLAMAFVAAVSASVVAVSSANDGSEATSLIPALPFETGGQTEGSTEIRPVRRVSVADAIRMTRIAGTGALESYSGGLSADFASFSPDGKRFVFLVKKGNLEQNTNEYSMLLFETDKVFQSPKPKTLVSFVSSSNREAITDLTWLADSDTIMFLGEQPGQTRQLYSVNCTSRKITELTEHPTNLEAYSTSLRGEEIVYVADRPKKDLTSETVLRNGFHVSTELLSDLIQGQVKDSQADLDYATDLFVAGARLRVPRHLEVPGRVDEQPISLSPDGAYLIVQTFVPEVPDAWREYKDGLLQNVIAQKFPKGTPSQLLRYALLDVKTGRSSILLNSPISYYGSEVEWAADSKSVVLTGVFLPLDVTGKDVSDEHVSGERGAGETERTIRATSAVAAEVRIPDLEVSRITSDDSAFVRWVEGNRSIALRSRRGKQGSSAAMEYFQKRESGWKRVDMVSRDAVRPEIVAEQGPNSPPRVVAVDPPRRTKVLLIDLNPQFKDLRFGKVELIKWKDHDGQEVEAGLYLPPDYVPQRKYPLVIQTHGFDPHGFWMDGPFSTAFAAQPLAAQGIAVLQVPDSHNWSLRDTPGEASSMMSRFESGIEYLDAKEIIDPDRVGLVGFSQTCLYVQYMLTHSKVPIAAAVVADGLDGGYFSYLAFANAGPYLTASREGFAGAPPFGDGLSLWRERAPGFLLDKVRAPVLIQAIHPPSLLGEWEWFAGLSRLNKPVDFIYIPTGYHILQKPWDRMVSQQSTVDWFRFWLKGEEDPSPEKAEQYQRWRQMRNPKAGAVMNQNTSESYR
jgi:dipeptidyl aminopeptidase/acylaminoacyl peptidase